MSKPDNGTRFGASLGKLLALAAAAVLLDACVVPQSYYPEQPQQYSGPAPVYADPQGGGYDPQGGGYYPQAGEGDQPFELRASEPPPPLPIYDQPPCPASGYLWTPGYWAYGPAGYFWVPGTWVEPPQVGLYWTPGYWAWSGAIFLFHVGYWGPHVGFYGGVSYGGGYDGEGYVGGRWIGRDFAYNRAVNNVNVTIIHNTYNQTVINNNETVNRISYAGGPNGIHAAMTPQQRMAARDRHIGGTPMQMMHVRDASENRELWLRVNQGRPPIAATPRPGAFDAPNVVRARGATLRPEVPQRAMPNEQRYGLPQQAAPNGRSAVPQRAMPNEQRYGLPQQAAPNERSAVPQQAAPNGRYGLPQSPSYGKQITANPVAPPMGDNGAARPPERQRRQFEYRGAQPPAARPPMVQPEARPEARPRQAPASQPQAWHPPQRPAQAQPKREAHPRPPAERIKQEPDHGRTNR